MASPELSRNCPELSPELPELRALEGYPGTKTEKTPGSVKKDEG